MAWLRKHGQPRWNMIVWSWIGPLRRVASACVAAKLPRPPPSSLLSLLVFAGAAVLTITIRGLEVPYASTPRLGEIYGHVWLRHTGAPPTASDELCACFCCLLFQHFSDPSGSLLSPLLISLDQTLLLCTVLRLLRKVLNSLHE